MAAVFLQGCAGEIPVTRTVRFAVFGNTAPPSPFSGFTESLDTVIEEIESEKPAIVIHTGNAVYGGSDEEGIYENDVRRQCRIFFSSMRNFHSACYTIPGEKDLFNGSSEIYREYSGRGASFSFNYGSIHFTVVDTSGTEESFAESRQMDWLRKDLEGCRKSSTVFIIMNRPFNKGRRSRTLPVPDELHNEFMKYNVKYVISGEGKRYSLSVFDSIKYISAGCAGYIDMKENRRTSQYYLFTYANGELDVRPVRVDLRKRG